MSEVTDLDAEMAEPAGSAPQPASIADALLSLSEPDAELAWRQLPREALLTKVAKYRSAIRDVAGSLRNLGEGGLPTADELLVLGRDVASAAPYAAIGPEAGPHGGTTAAAPLGALDRLPPGAHATSLNDPDDSELMQFGEEGVDFTYGSVDDVDPSEWQVPPHCVPIHANVTTFDWPSLYEHCQFDVIMMDPPWQLATANPTRGVALGYSQLSDDHISGLPVPQLQRQGGFLFVWVINAKYKWTLDLFDKWGYRLVDEVVWVKMTVNRRLAKSHGYYLQHAKEVCLVAKRGNPPAAVSGGVGSDIIFSERRGQSQKPEEIYELVEQLVPNGRYLEIFARKNNLRDFWVSIGNEVTGTGLPEEDMKALRELNCIPGAVYGKTGGGGGGACSRGTSAGSGAVGGEGAPGGGATGPQGVRAGPGAGGGAGGGGTGHVRATSSGSAATGAVGGHRTAAAATRQQGAGALSAPAAPNGVGSVTAVKPTQAAPEDSTTGPGGPAQERPRLRLSLKIRRPEQQQQPHHQPEEQQGEEGRDGDQQQQQQGQGLQDAAQGIGLQPGNQVGAGGWEGGQVACVAAGTAVAPMEVDQRAVGTGGSTAGPGLVVGPGGPLRAEFGGEEEEEEEQAQEEQAGFVPGDDWA